MRAPEDNWPLNAAERSLPSPPPCPKLMFAAGADQVVVSAAIDGAEYRLTLTCYGMWIIRSNPALGIPENPDEVEWPLSYEDMTEAAQRCQSIESELWDRIQNQIRCRLLTQRSRSHR